MGFISSTDGSFVKFVSGTPIGCTGPYEFGVNTCNITVHLSNTTDCPITLESDPHVHCGLSIRGITYAGLQRYGSWGYANYYLTSGDGWDNSGYKSYRYGTKLLVANGTQGDITDVHKIQFQPMSLPGNSFWNGYVLPDLTVSYMYISILLFNMAQQVK